MKTVIPRAIPGSSPVPPVPPVPHVRANNYSPLPDNDPPAPDNDPPAPGNDSPLHAMGTAHPRIRGTGSQGPYGKTCHDAGIINRQDSIDMKTVIPGTIHVSSSLPPVSPVSRVRANNYSPLPDNGPPLPDINSPVPDHNRPLSVRKRRSVRLRGYDYSQAGAYFITICTQNRHCRFGDITEGAMVLNDAGRAVADCWLQIPDHFPHVELDEWVVMPNHIHGIVIIVGANNHSPVQSNNYSPIQSNDDPPLQSNNHSPLHKHPTGTARTIGSVVRGFKIGVTQWYRQRSVPSKIWQRNYWDHIIRNESELNRIRQYILDNPMQWEQDSLHAPTAVGANNDSPVPGTPAYTQEAWRV